MQASYINALLGGLLIGLSATLMLLLNGRITGISGMFNGIVDADKSNISWRLCFIIALLIGASVHSFLWDASYYEADAFSPLLLVPAGFLVGFGTRTGGGCTSGHGVCGLGRLSIRSLVATLTFMTSAMISLFIFRHLLGLA